MSDKVKACLVLLAMYTLGTVSGVAWQTYRVQRHPLRPVYMTRHLRKLKKELQLSPEQEQSLREIFMRAHDRAVQINEEVSWDLADIHNDSIEAIHKILTPEQSAKFDQLHRRAHPGSNLDTDDQGKPAGSGRGATDGGVTS